MQDLQQQVQARMGMEEHNQSVTLSCAYFETIETIETIETLIRENPGARKAILRTFKKHYLREMEESLKKGYIHRELHRDEEFMNGGPRTSRFILEALAS